MLGLLMGTLAVGAQPVWPDLSTPTGGDIGAADAAVIVAIEDYAIVGDVPGARQNGLDWYTHMTEGRGIPAHHVRLLVDNEGVRESIEDAVAHAKRVVQDDGTLWLIFIGHGAPSRDGQDGVLVGWDTQQTAASIDARGVSHDALLADLQDGPQANTVAIFDACFSGQEAHSGAALAPGLQPMIPSGSLSARDAVVLSAGLRNERAGPLPGLDRPAFSYLVLGAMRGWADADGDGVVTAQETIDYSADVLSSMPLGRNQTPQLSGAQTDLIFGDAMEAGPSLSTIRREVVQQQAARDARPLTEPARLQGAWVPAHAPATHVKHQGSITAADHSPMMSVTALRAQLRTDGYYTCHIAPEIGMRGAYASIVVASDQQDALLFVPFTKMGLGLHYDTLRSRTEAGNGVLLEESGDALWVRSPGVAQVRFVSLSPEEAVVEWTWLGAYRIGGVRAKRTLCLFVPR